MTAMRRDATRRGTRTILEDEGQADRHRGDPMPAFIVSDHEAVSGRVRQVLLFDGLDCPAAHVVTVEDAAGGGRLAQGRPGLVVLVLGHDPERVLNLLAGLRQSAPSKVLVVGPASSKLVLRALRGGAADYIDEGDLELELQAALRRLREEPGGRNVAGKTIAVLAPCGGSGSSTLAANVAIVLAKEHREVALVDLKLEAGDLATLLDLRPVYTLADLTQNVARMDRVLLERSLIRHSSGVHLLAPPRTFAEVALITPEGVDQVLNLARVVFPYVVADVDYGYDDVRVRVLRRADVILMVLRLEFTALRNTRRAFDYLEHLGIDTGRVRLVVNRHGQPKEVPVSKAEEALGMKIFHFVPDDPRAVNRANNNGVPFVLEAPSARVSQSVTHLAMSINGAHKKH
jgi:pilus assembly protein CpaE